jgi:hypothetical protein
MPLKSRGKKMKNSFKRRLAIAFCMSSALLSCGNGHASDANSGLAGKMIVGYQGWFGCPSDFEKNNNWQHWFLGDVRQDHFTVDLLPSVREINTEDLCDTGLHQSDGSATRLFSSQNEHVVGTHFRWMKDHGIDGAAVQRFVAGLPSSEKKLRFDNVLGNARRSAETTARVFYVAYDISGADPKTVVADVRNDWRHLVDDLKITKSPSYLREHGKPVLQLWGFGFDDRPGTPDEVAALINDLKSGNNGLEAVTLIGGVPANWRTLSGDSKSDPGWAKVYRSYDVISPWSVGRFANDEGVDAFVKNNVVPDLAEAKRNGVQYMPVIFPGFSWYNLMSNRNQPGRAVLNQIPRHCGRFLWKQVASLLGVQVNMLYAAMFDEVDEGTALLPTETQMDKLPAGASMVVLNQDGCSLPDDWYLRVTGKAAEYLRHHQVPSSNLDAVIKP